MTRRISFEGDDTAYITFLEARILELKSSLRQSSQQPTYFQTSSSGLANSNADRNPRQFFGIPHRNTCQIQTASDDQSHDGDTQIASPDLDKQRYPRQNSGDSAAIQIVEYNPNAHLDPDQTNQSALNQTKKQQVRTLVRFSCPGVTRTFSIFPRYAGISVSTYLRELSSKSQINPNDSVIPTITELEQV
jgi:hypothetical protein